MVYEPTSLCCVLFCLVFCFYALLCLFCHFPFLLACLSPSVCQYCFRPLVISPVLFPPLSPPVPRLLITASVYLSLRSPMNSLSVRCWCCVSV